MPEVMQQIRTQLGKDAVILQSKEVKSGGLFGIFKKPRVEVVAALDPHPIVRQQEKPKKRKIHQDDLFKRSHSRDTNQQNIVSEIKHLRKMLEHQHSTDEQSFTHSFQMFYDYLINQEVEREIAQQIIEQIEQSHDDALNVPIDAIITDIKTWIEDQLDHLSFSSIHPTTRIVQLIGPTGVGKTTTIAKLAAKSMLEAN